MRTEVPLVRTNLADLRWSRDLPLIVTRGELVPLGDVAGGTDVAENSSPR
jgi:hypothetical protein